VPIYRGNLVHALAVLAEEGQTTVEAKLLSGENNANLITAS